MGATVDNLPVQYEKLLYTHIIAFVPSFLSLDISVKGTGWTLYVDGEMTQGRYTLESLPDDDLGRRREFKNFLKSLVGDRELDTVFVEDVIGGINFKTDKILYQLNPIVDDLVDDGVLNIRNVVREGNKEWKAALKKCSGYVSDIKGNKDEKQIVRDSLYNLGYGDRTTNTIAEDIYDSLGLAIGAIFRKFYMQKEKRASKLKTDVTKGFKVLQYSDEYDAIEKATSLNREVHKIRVDGVRDVPYMFKQLVKKLDRHTDVFLIETPSVKLGLLGLSKKLDLTQEKTFLVVYELPKKIKK